MTVVYATLFATTLVSLMYLFRLQRLWSTHWKPFREAFPRSHAVDKSLRQLSKPCALVLNGKMLGDGTPETDRFSLAQPRVVVLRDGIAFFVTPDPMRLFTPVLVKFIFVKSFGRVRDADGEWIEVEFASGNFHGWSHIPTSFAGLLRSNGIAEGIPAYRLHILEPAEDWSPQSHASIYQRLLKCSPWTAVKLKEVEHRDPLDVIDDLEALTKALDDVPASRADSYATRLQTDPSTSYFLLHMLDECFRKGEPDHRKDVDQLLVFARARLVTAMRPHALLLAPIDYE